MSRKVRSASELSPLPAYRLEYEEDVPDCNGHGMVFRHIASGARICVISNDDDDKVFNISFRTNPTDDTGVPHITEHSVLCGSSKYPPKDPFMELAKGSLNTFLNAFTYPDKTCYPVASCNDRDFANLTDVYMDAVLHPNTYRREEIFRQEGWRYELEDRNDPITINGVVYSEMKGAFSSPDNRLEYGIMRALYPDNTYGVVSGGDPKSIPDLTYEDFLDFHRFYYHPTNSYIFLYGDMDVEERLEWLDREYLSGYSVQPVDSEVKYQEPVGTVEVKTFYPAGAEDDAEDSSFLAWAVTLGDYSNILECEAISMLCDVLFNIPGAPVREALIKAGIGQDVSCSFIGDMKQPCILMTIRNASSDRYGDMKRILRETLEDQVKNGINRKSLLGQINGEEFRYCEADVGFPRGIEYSRIALSTWLYDDSMALSGLHMKELFPVMRDRIEEGYYEGLIEKYLLNGASQVYMVMEPKQGMVDENAQELADRLAAMKASMTDEELDGMIRRTAALKAYQSEPSTPEELATIPMLAREDIDKKSREYIIEETDISGVETYFHDIDTNGIVYLKLLFDVDMLTVDEAGRLSAAARLMGNMNTDSHDYLELNNEISIWTGGIGSDIDVFRIADGEGSFRPMFRIGGAAMTHNFEKLCDLIEEELYHTKYADTVRIREVFGESRARMRVIFSESGQRTASMHALGGISAYDRYGELLRGIPYYNRICGVLDMDDEEMLAEAEAMKALFSKFTGRDNLIIDITCDREAFGRIRPRLEKLVAGLHNVRTDDIPGASRRGPIPDPAEQNEGFRIPSEVNYVALAGMSGAVDTVTAGRMQVAQKILNTEYLWNNVRVLGGAYGSWFVFDRIKGTGVFTSYRDPNLGDTLEVYRRSAEFLKTFDPDERTMTKFVIGTIGEIDTPLGAEGRGTRALAAKITGVEYGEIQTIRDTVLAAQPDDVRATAEVFERMINDGNICAVGTESDINAGSELFLRVSDLL